MEAVERMRKDRIWVALIALITVLSVVGCSTKKAPPPPPPAPVAQPPVTDVEPEAKPAGPMDEKEVPPPKTAQEVEQEARQAGLLGDVFFDFDKYDLRSDARERLAKNADFMKQNPGVSFTVEGHCDERGTNEYNIALGQNRSSAAVDYLVSLGVAANRFKIISYGEEKPFCTESTEACWQKNRRARFVVTSVGG